MDEIIRIHNIPNKYKSTDVVLLGGLSDLHVRLPGHGAQAVTLVPTLQGLHREPWDLAFFPSVSRTTP